MHLIDLDVAAFDIFDLPPLNEYELYIKNFGRSDTKQVILKITALFLHVKLSCNALDVVLRKMSFFSVSSRFG